jgi:hypothetical protein
MECIICQDSGLEKLQENTSCSCKYKCHSSCWIDYVHSKTLITCPLCRKDISIKPKPTSKTPLIQPSAPPYTSHTLLQENEQQITYQEFIDIIQQHNTNENTVIEVINQSQQPQQQQQIIINSTVSQKIFKIIIGLVVIALISVLLSVILK